jgi:hypothetical protein
MAPSFTSGQLEVGVDQPRTDPTTISQEERARALIVPVADAQPTPDTVPAVQPGLPEPKVPSSVAMPEEERIVGGTPCPWCATPNPEGRHFCRRCAMPMSRAQETVDRRRAWWWRLLYQRERELPYIGQRPRIRRGPGRLVRMVAQAAIVLIVIVAAIVWGPSAVTNIEDHFATPVWRAATTVTASSQDDFGYPATKLIDQGNNTWWEDGLPSAGNGTDNGAGQWVQASFDTPLNLLDVMITPGASVTQSTFDEQASPHTVMMTLTDTNGKSSSQLITLADGPGPQPFSIHGNNIVTVRFTIESAYPASAAQSPNPEIAITELEFFSK